MIEAYESTLPHRIAFAVAFFFILGLRDWIKHPKNPTRVKEYLFLIVSMSIAIVYGLVHDHITATVSHDYFLHAKGLDADPQPYRVGVSWLAVKATYGPGLLVGALLLIANNPARGKRQLTYPHLLRLCVYPVGVAAVCAVVGGVLSVLIGARTWLRDAAFAYTSVDHVNRFLAVWGVHAGSYIGAALGTVLAVVKVVLGRKAQRTAPC